MTHFPDSMCVLWILCVFGYAEKIYTHHGAIVPRDNLPSWCRDIFFESYKIDESYLKV